MIMFAIVMLEITAHLHGGGSILTARCTILLCRSRIKRTGFRLEGDSRIGNAAKTGGMGSV